jgi:hypothetical protein
LKQFFHLGQPDDDASLSSNKGHDGPTIAKEAAKGVADRSALTCTINGTTLSVTAPAALHESLRRTLDAWNENGLTQIAVETRFLTSNRDLVSDLGVSWRFLAIPGGVFIRTGKCFTVGRTRW